MNVFTAGGGGGGGRPWRRRRSRGRRRLTHVPAQAHQGDMICRLGHVDGQSVAWIEIVVADVGRAITIVGEEIDVGGRARRCQPAMPCRPNERPSSRTKNLEARDQTDIGVQVRAAPAPTATAESPSDADDRSRRSTFTRCGGERAADPELIRAAPRWPAIGVLCLVAEPSDELTDTECHCRRLAGFAAHDPYARRGWRRSAWETPGRRSAS